MSTQKTTTSANATGGAGNGQDILSSESPTLRCSVPLLHADESFAHTVMHDLSTLLNTGLDREQLKALNDLAGSDWPPLAEAARDTLDYAREHAEAALTLQADRDAVRELIRR